MSPIASWFPVGIYTLGCSCATVPQLVHPLHALPPVPTHPFRSRRCESERRSVAARPSTSGNAQRLARIPAPDTPPVTDGPGLDNDTREGLYARIPARILHLHPGPQ